MEGNDGCDNNNRPSGSSNQGILFRMFQRNIGGEGHQRQESGKKRRKSAPTNNDFDSNTGILRVEQGDLHLLGQSPTRSRKKPHKPPKHTRRSSGGGSTNHNNNISESTSNTGALASQGRKHNQRRAERNSNRRRAEIPRTAGPEEFHDETTSNDDEEEMASSGDDSSLRPGAYPEGGDDDNNMLDEVEEQPAGGNQQLEGNNEDQDGDPSQFLVSAVLVSGNDDGNNDSRERIAEEIRDEILRKAVVGEVTKVIPASYYFMIVCCVVIVVIVLATGLGVGLSNKNTNKNTKNQALVNQSPTTQPTGTPMPTSFGPDSPVPSDAPSGIPSQQPSFAPTTEFQRDVTLRVGDIPLQVDTSLADGTDVCTGSLSCFVEFCSATLTTWCDWDRALQSNATRYTFLYRPLYFGPVTVKACGTVQVPRLPCMGEMAEVHSMVEESMEGDKEESNNVTFSSLSCAYTSWVANNQTGDLIYVQDFVSVDVVLVDDGEPLALDDRCLCPPCYRTKIIQNFTVEIHDHDECIYSHFPRPFPYPDVLTHRYSTTFATIDDIENEGTCGSATNSTAPGVWYQVTGTGSPMTASTCNNYTDFDTQITIFKGDTCSQLQCVAGNNDSCGRQSQVQWPAESGQKYYILVHGFGAAVGLFELEISSEIPVPRADNDFCESATLIPEESLLTVGGKDHWRGSYSGDHDSQDMEITFPDTITFSFWGSQNDPDIPDCVSGDDMVIGSDSFGIWYTFETRDIDSWLAGGYVLEYEGIYNYVTPNSYNYRSNLSVSLFHGNCGNLICEQPWQDGEGDGGGTNYHYYTKVKGYFLKAFETYFVRLSVPIIEDIEYGIQLSRGVPLIDLSTATNHDCESSSPVNFNETLHLYADDPLNGTMYLWYVFEGGASQLDDVKASWYTFVLLFSDGAWASVSVCTGSCQSLICEDAYQFKVSERLYDVFDFPEVNFNVSAFETDDDVYISLRLDHPSSQGPIIV